MPRETTPELEDAANCNTTIANALGRKPVHVTADLASEGPLFLSQPLFGPLLFENKASDARDHCANERTFLSWLRLSMYLAVVSCAIIMSFHLHYQPTELELRMALPLGIMFWILSFVCLGSGLATYIRTVTKYSRQAALVQSGWKTQVVFTVVAVSIIGTCIILLSTGSPSLT
ncbi:DUF domain-containing protein [Paracoccidioides lutzii Pb01]|uniref:DUF domain-containing protein n=1 Tax=Paracoccidioides lutzii (strain ATCC MYA-826 / Pb01) TaxID=502779 RepID=C1GZL7_PARBA|nr:DUF domain-containing protein [Paracoccidioides lutzii Pb01]EEH42040.1 DUF domain-containing protein [Paracoccidioides lutzii Pb01]